MPGDVDPATLLLFETRFNDLILTDGLAAYGDPQDPLIPVGELTRLLELDVNIQPATGRIVGRIGEAGRSLLVDAQTLSAKDGAKSVSLAPDDIAVGATEIYLKASALQRILPLTVEVQADALQMRLTPTELLPIEGRMQREQRASMLGQAGGPAPEVMRVETPYRLFTPPALDVGLGAGVQSSEPKTPYRYDVRIGGDLLYSNFQGYLASDEQGELQAARATLERRSAEGRLLGPLRARIAAAGDVFTPGLSIGPRSVGGRGVTFSTAPLDRASIFNRTDIRGDLPTGYSAELYVNDTLVAIQNTPSNNGRYEFLNVALLPGLNSVRIILYGPRGERTEEHRVINVGPGLLGRGEATLEFGAVQQDRPLFRVGPFQGANGQFFAGGTRMVASLNYGLTSRLTVLSGVGIYSTPFFGEQQIAMAGVRSSLLGFAAQLDAAVSADGGFGVTGGLVGRLWGVSAVARRAQYGGGFIDENLLISDATRNPTSSTGLDLDASLKIGRRSLPLSFRGIYVTYGDGTNQIQADVRASSAVGGVLVSAGALYERPPSLTNPRDVLSGYLSATTYRSFLWELRAALDYEFVPEFRARTLELSADRRMSDTWSLRFGVSKPFDVKNGASLVASSVHRTRFGDFAITGGYEHQTRGWRIGIQDNFGLAWNPAARRYVVTPPGAGTGGAVLLHAFIDENGDGVFNPGEKPAPKVMVEGGERRVDTNEEGYAYITGFGAAPTTQLNVVIDAVQDTQNVTGPPSLIQFSPRAGSVTRINYPLRPTGEIGVRIVLRRPDGQTVGLSATQIQLTDAKGTVRKGVTEFDGTAFLQELPLGDYKLSLEPEQAARLKLALAKPIDIRVSANGSADVVAEVRFEGQDTTRMAEADLAPAPAAPPPAATINLDDSSALRSLRLATLPPPRILRAPATNAEVRITIMLRRPDRRLVAMSDARVQLVDDSGAVASEGVTAPDGLAVLPAPPPGQYRLMLEPSQAAQLRMRLAYGITVSVADGRASEVMGEVLYESRPLAALN